MGPDDRAALEQRKMMLSGSAQEAQETLLQLEESLIMLRLESQYSAPSVDLPPLDSSRTAPPPQVSSFQMPSGLPPFPGQGAASPIPYQPSNQAQMSVQAYPGGAPGLESQFSQGSMPYMATQSFQSPGLQSQVSQGSMQSMQNPAFMGSQMGQMQMNQMQMGQMQMGQGSFQPQAMAQQTQQPAPQVQKEACVVCLENDRNCVLYPCGHQCVCQGCGQELISRKSPCPLCRSAIKDCIKVFR